MSGVWLETMKQPPKAGSKTAKARRLAALKPKGRSAAKAIPSRGSAPADQETEVARLTRELNEALEQQIIFVHFGAARVTLVAV